MSLEFMADTPTFVSKLDNDGYLPISYLTSQKSIKDSKLDNDTIIEIIRSIDSLSLSPDNTGVRISLPVARKTLILREIPDDVTESRIRDLFSGFTVECIKKEIANSWFVTFDSEESALQAFTFAQQSSFSSHPIRARVKSEFYMKVFLKRLRSVISDTPTRKLSSAAKPFVLSYKTMLKTPTFDDDLGDDIPQLGACWADPMESQQIGLEQVERLTGSYSYYHTGYEETLPFVPTHPVSVGYETPFVHYSPSEILEIVKVGLGRRAFLVGNDRSLHAANRDSRRPLARGRGDLGESLADISHCEHGVSDERTNHVDRPGDAQRHSEDVLRRQHRLYMHATRNGRCGDGGNAKAAATPETKRKSANESVSEVKGVLLCCTNHLSKRWLRANCGSDVT